MDTKLRSWTKSVIWRLVGIVLLGGISYAITRDWQEMTLITLIFHSLRLILYYVHERIWERIHWGRNKHPLSGLPVKGPLDPEHMAELRDRLRSLGYLED